MWAFRIPWRRYPQQRRPPRSFVLNLVPGDTRVTQTGAYTAQGPGTVRATQTGVYSAQGPGTIRVTQVGAYLITTTPGGGSPVGCPTLGASVVTVLDCIHGRSKTVINLLGSAVPVIDCLHGQVEC